MEMIKIREKVVIKAFQFNKNEAIKTAIKRGFTNVSEGAYEINGISMYFQQFCDANIDITMYLHHHGIKLCDGDWIIIKNEYGHETRDILKPDMFKTKYDIIEKSE